MAKGDIEIRGSHPEGKFVKLYNRGDAGINVGGLQLIRQWDGNETVFKFNRLTRIQAKAVVTVWSADVGGPHEPPANIVMKRKWCVGDNIKSQLPNFEVEEVATRS